MHAQGGSENTGGVFETYQELEAFGPGVLCIIHYDPLSTGGKFDKINFSSTILERCRKSYCGFHENRFSH
jgi:hypothetical protein